MKTIDTVAADIKGMFGARKKDGELTISEEALAKFGAAAAMAVSDAMRERTAGRKPRTLYMSEIGQPCMRKLWYSINWPELGEQMQGHTLFKFLYGNLIEEMALLLAEAAGHKVERRQERVVYEYGNYKIVGKMDAVIDGVVVDVKGLSSFGFKKMAEGLTDENDSFGYRTQLSGYNGLENPRFARQGFLAIDKQNGHIGFFETEYQPVNLQVAKAVAAVSSDTEPARAFDLQPTGSGGNEKLCVECSYCPFKQTCWRDANDGAGLRAFAYSTGPVFLGTTTWAPRVAEIPLVRSPAHGVEVLHSPFPEEAHPEPAEKDVAECNESS